jgi:putative kinase
VSLETVDPYPWFLNKPMHLLVNDLEVHAKITATQWSDHWHPLLTRLRERWLAAQPRRFMVAIAGPPGSGKSVLAEQLNWITSRGFLGKLVHSIALPMDGFHFPQKYLDTHTRKLDDGSEIPLSHAKGQFDTIDANALREHLKLLAIRSDEVNWPGYSRKIHDIVPNKFTVRQGVNLVFIEGNFLLLNKGPFAGIPSLFDLRIFIDIPPAKIMGNLMARHIAGGREVEVAKRWVKQIDLPNARLVESTRDRADVFIQRDIDHEGFFGITWREDTPSRVN